MVFQQLNATHRNRIAGVMIQWATRQRLLQQILWKAVQRRSPIAVRWLQGTSESGALVDMLLYI